MWKVYKIETENRKIYIGCTKQSLKKRMISHKAKKMSFSLITHNIDVMFETSSYEEAQKFEAYLIQKYDTTNPQKGYNRRFGGSKYGFPKYIDLSRDIKGNKNPLYGKKHSLETREKIRQKALARPSETFSKNKIKTPEQLEKLQKGKENYILKNGGYWKGKKLSKEACEKISLAMKGNQQWLGKKHSEETKEKIRQKRKDRAKLNCNIEHCLQKHKAKGYCETHYRRFLKHGIPFI